MWPHCWVRIPNFQREEVPAFKELLSKASGLKQELRKIRRTIALGVEVLHKSSVVADAASFE